MFRKLIVGTAALLLSLAVSQTMFAAPAEAGCRKQISALGKWSYTYAGARYSARRAWRRKVRAKHGREFAKWRKAKAESYGCWQHEQKERCRVKARPCN